MRNFQLVLPIPSTGKEFESRFPTRKACLDAIMDSRWPEGFTCSQCGHARYWLHRRRPIIECTRCGRQTSPLAGTLFAHTKLPLPRLFKLCYLLAASPRLGDANLARRAGVSTPTAGAWRRKLESRLATGGSGGKACIAIHGAEVGEPWREAPAFRRLTQ